ncbi:MAG: FHA domain-containing protein, partial [Deltaproteobacteria bacterium]|nr:FHA domain-containing protein [Deltaproteobacteria bacterium]
RHGTFIRIREERAISNGDQLRIGHGLFNVEIKGKKRRPAPDGSSWLGSSGMEGDYFGRLLRLGPEDVVIEAHLLKAPETTIGRTGGDILMPDDPFVSSRHAAFVWKADSCVLKDLGSTNGCYLRARSRVALNDGDHLLLGHHVFLFRRSGQTAKQEKHP